MKTRCLGCMEEYDGEFEVCPFCGYVQGTPAKEAYHITPGVVIKNRYLIGRVLGSGGFGITYIGYDRILEKKVAIKEYLPTEFATRMPNQTNVTVYAGDKQEQFLAGMKKSLDEAQRLAEFQQTPGITQVFDFFEENNTAYIVMELLEGETLKDRLKREGKMTVEEALPIILAVLGALKAVHVKNIIHRDIAPDNIYLLKNGEVKLLDFGASRQVTTTHSKSLTVILKLGYAPVEQYQSGGNQGPWTDVYALAATFYKMITGVRPQESPERRIKDMLKEPSKLGVKIDKNIENALMNALHVRIEDRTQSAEEFENALYSPEVERTQATIEKNDLGKWPLWLKIVCGVAGAAVITGGVLMATGVINVSMPSLPTFNQSGVMVPSLINLSQDAAKQRLENQGLKFEIGGTEPSDTIIKNYVLSQTDADGNKLNPGDFVDAGSTVKVVLSSGTGKINVPDIQWMQEDSARSLLEELEVVAINTVEDTETWAPAGVVTGTDPEIGSEMKLEDTITIKIAAGNGSVEGGEVSVPDVAGSTEADAYDTLKQQGLYLVKKELQNSTQVPAGQIISQEQQAGSTVQAGTSIQVIVSAGPKKIQLPSVVHMAAAEAQSNLESLGLSVTITQDYSDTVDSGNVISQSIDPGTVDEGTNVTLTVSQGARPAQTVQQNNNNNGNNNRNNSNSGNTSGGSSGNSGGNTAATQAPTPQTQAPQTQAPAPETQAPSSGGSSLDSLVPQL